MELSEDAKEKLEALIAQLCADLEETVGSVLDEPDDEPAESPVVPEGEPVEGSVTPEGESVEDGEDAADGDEDEPVEVAAEVFGVDLHVESGATVEVADLSAR